MAEDVERIELFVAHHIPDLTTAMVLSSVLLFLIPASVFLRGHEGNTPKPCKIRKNRGFYRASEKIEESSAKNYLPLPMVCL